MIQITRQGFVADPDHIEAASREFDERGCVMLPKLLEPQLLTFVLDSIARGRWNAIARTDFDSNFMLESCTALVFLHFVSNWPGLLDAAHAITRSGPFTWFEGCVYRMAPGMGHYDSWHDDDIDGRRAALSLNLSPRGYRGGLLQMRKRDRTDLMVEVANTDPGDAILFRLSKDLVHRVTEVEGNEPKTAFAGWFNVTAASLKDRLHEQRLNSSLSSAGGSL